MDETGTITLSQLESILFKMGNSSLLKKDIREAVEVIKSSKTEFYNNIAGLHQGRGLY